MATNQDSLGSDSGKSIPFDLYHLKHIDDGPGTRKLLGTTR